MPTQQNQYKITLFGIPNCDTVKKARTWLEENARPFDFHNFKKDGLSAEAIRIWLQHASLDQIINRKGTTWRALDDVQKQAADEVESAIELIIAQPSLIKRPVLQIDMKAKRRINLGFNAETYQTIFTEIN